MRVIKGDTRSLDHGSRISAPLQGDSPTKTHPRMTALSNIRKRKTYPTTGSQASPTCTLPSLEILNLCQISGFMVARIVRTRCVAESSWRMSAGESAVSIGTRISCRNLRPSVCKTPICFSRLSTFGCIICRNRRFSPSA